MVKTRFLAILIILVGGALGYFNYISETQTDTLASRFPFKLGLDLQGGSHLIYRTDVSNIDPDEIDESMDALRDVIERRVNLFGISEPRVLIEEKGKFKKLQEREYRLIVELPGVTDISQATAMIGQTPFLEFKSERSELESQEILDAQKVGERLYEDPYFISSDLTGRYLEKATLEFEQLMSEPRVVLVFDDEGKKIFGDLTRDNIGKRIAIYLDGAPISVPVVRDEITGGRAEISGGFTPDEAKLLVGRLNSGALPVPIELILEQGIGATLGEETLNKGVMAGIYGIVMVAIFLILWYRLPGLVSAVSLFLYIIFMLTIFKLLGVTLTAAGIAGFILSIGMAVDANVLIFERIREEINFGDDVQNAIERGFKRAWLSIRDGNISSIITAVILFWFGTSLVKGFALTFGIGVLVSMFSAIIVTKTFLISLNIKGESKFSRFLLGSGISG